MSRSRDAARSVERLTDRPLAGVAALFLDRDGVLIEDHGHVGTVGRTDLIEEAIEAAAEASRAGAPLVLVTNQSGVARGWYDWSGFDAVNERIRDGLRRRGADLDVIVASARMPGHSDPWRKPGPGMLLEVRRRWGVDLSSSWIVGDRASDLRAGRSAALAGGVLVGPTEESQLTQGEGIALCAAMRAGAASVEVAR